MTVLVQTLRRYHPLPSLPKWSGLQKRFFVIASLIFIAIIIPGGVEAAIDVLSEAYLAVSVFVAGTLALVYSAERAFKTDLGVWLQHFRRWQVPVAALLGGFPGCGGAIIAITQYTRGYLSFGGVVATLTATMGDAMFLLLARESQTAIGVLAVSLIVAIVSGYTVDAIHGPDFMRTKKAPHRSELHEVKHINNLTLSVLERLWLILIVPGIAIGILGAFQLDVDVWIAQWIAIEPAFWLGTLGATVAVIMWCINGGEQNPIHRSHKTPVTHSVIHTTNFVSAWVVFAFVGYALLVASTGIELSKGFSVWGPLVPAIAVLIGMVPGCGPQILVTTMYLSGAVPLSAQLANAMANDGDALFPAIATAPRAALMATLYSAIPALIVGYSWYWVME